MIHVIQAIYIFSCVLLCSFRNLCVGIISVLLSSNFFLPSFCQTANSQIICFRPEELLGSAQFNNSMSLTRKKRKVTGSNCSIIPIWQGKKPRLISTGLSAYDAQIDDLRTLSCNARIQHSFLIIEFWG